MVKLYYSESYDMFYVVQGNSVEFYVGENLWLKSSVEAKNFDTLYESIVDDLELIGEL